MSEAVKSKKPVLEITSVDQILAALDRRDIALWVQLGRDDVGDDLVSFLTLPWMAVYIDGGSRKLFDALELKNSDAGPMVRRRGYIHLIESDPARIALPPRCLPIFLLDGRTGAGGSSGFAAKLRRMTMLEELRRSGVLQLVVAPNSDSMPAELGPLWLEGFRSSVTVVSEAPHIEDVIQNWVGGLTGAFASNLFRKPLIRAASEVVSRFVAEYPEDRHVIRMRNVRGPYSIVDITELEDPEHPVLDRFSLIEERHLTPLVPAELTEGDFAEFFEDSTRSWKPYAAGLPWLREHASLHRVSSMLGRLDSIGPAENRIAFMSCESGAGGTTYARTLAWHFANEGYPVLIAKQLAFSPDALSISNFLGRITANRDANEGDDGVAFEEGGGAGKRRYETPWIIIFDVVHWRSRESELAGFRNELIKSGRPVLIFVISGSVMPVAFYNETIFKKIGELGHVISREQSEQLGVHLNKYLIVFGKSKRSSEWERFYREHTVQLIDGVAAFWLSLSFWIRGQYDLTESIQEWMYRCLKEKVDERLWLPILQIAALSSERVAMPEGLLPKVDAEWPVSHLLEDSRSEVAPIGLTAVKSEGRKYWALIHDILGRFLINATFYDFEVRKKLGFESAMDAEHLRFQLLRQIGVSPVLGEREFRKVGEEFATFLFKVDPDHGRGSFAKFWREVLQALDDMPQSLREGSRVFLHHSAVSRRRISKLDPALYNVTSEDRVRLLSDSVRDITYAIERIPYKIGDDSDLNLYNSLANAYLDWAAAESDFGTGSERVNELRELANAATRRAYEESPSNSYTLETYVKNLIENSRDPSPESVINCIEALGLTFTALNSSDPSFRRGQLSEHASRALALLLMNEPDEAKDRVALTALDVLIAAWKILSRAGGWVQGGASSVISDAALAETLEVLSNPIGHGNLQILQLRYDLVALAAPYDFPLQLELVEQLVNSKGRIAPQLRLEYAILLYQRDRAKEGDRLFHQLRQVWRESESLVQVPDRLRWLLSAGTLRARSVTVVVGSGYGTRANGVVREFGNLYVPFRPEEFGQREPQTGAQFTALVSFGHNGPFLRPVTTVVGKGE